MSFFTRYKLLLLHLLFAACLLPAMIFAYRRPHYNMDMVSYMAIILEMDRHDTTNVHHDVYNILRQEVPNPELGYIINSEGYRESMMNNTAYFYDHLPIYKAKPLYNRLCYFFYKAGFSLTRSTCMPGIISFFLIGMLLLHWLNRIYPSLFSWLAALLLMYSDFMMTMPRISSPDCLSGFFLLAAFYFIVEKYSQPLMFIFFVLATLCRMDNAVTASLMIGGLWLFGKKWGRRLPFRNMLLMGAGILACYIFTCTVAIGGEWGLWYYSTFMKHFNVSYQVRESFSFRDYFELVYSKLITGIVYSHFSWFLLFVLMILYDGVRARKLSLEQFLALWVLLVILVRFIVFPDISDRFLMSFYLLIAMLFARKFLVSKGTLLKEQQFTIS
jgi:hypothetical protein